MLDGRLEGERDRVVDLDEIEQRAEHAVHAEQQLDAGLGVRGNECVEEGLHALGETVAAL